MRSADSWRHLALALTCAGLLALACSAAEAQSGIAVSVALARLPGADVIAPDGKNAAPGDMIYYAFTVRNTGDLASSYRLAVATALGWSAALPLHSNKRIGTLQPGQAETVPVAVTISAGALPGSTGDTTLTATADEKPKPSDSATVTTTVVATPEVKVVTAPPGQNGTAGALITYQFQLKNTGLVATAFTLKAVSSPTWTTTLPAYPKGKTATLAPGQTVMVAVTVRIPATAAAGATCTTTLTATSISRPRLSGEDRVTTTVVAAGALILTISPTLPGAPGGHLWAATLSHKGEPRQVRVTAQSSRGWPISVDGQAAAGIELPDEGVAQAAIELRVPDGAQGEDCLVISVLDSEQDAVLTQTAVMVMLD